MRKTMVICLGKALRGMFTLVTFVSLAVCFGLTGTALAQNATLFSANFDNGNSGAVTNVANLGAPATGTWSFFGAVNGGISTNTDKAAAFANWSTATPGLTLMPNNGVAMGSTYPVTKTVDAPGTASSALIANFTSPGTFTGSGSTTIRFKWASFGVNNTGGFKYAFVRGLDASDNEVFELLWVQANSVAASEIFARGTADTQTTLTSISSGIPQGTALVSRFTTANSTVAANEPAIEIGVTVTLTNGQVNYAFDSGTLTGSNLTYAVNSAAATITKLEFSEVWNSTTAGSGYRGYWLDDVSVMGSPPLTITSVSPSALAGRQTLATNGSLQLQFSTPLAAGATNFLQVLDGRGGDDITVNPPAIPGVWTVNGGTNAIFTPTQPFLPGALVLLHVTTNAVSVSGQSLDAEQWYSFLVDDGVDFGVNQTFLPAFMTVENGAHSLQMRIYTPATGTGPFPVMFWVHGGGWSGGTPTNSIAQTLDTYLTRHLGVVLVSVAYRCLGSDGTFSEGLADVNAAVAYILAHAAAYNIDPNRLGFYGGSAGTPLAALAAQQNPGARCFIGYNGIYNFVDNPGSGFPGGTAYQQNIPSLFSNSAIFNLRVSPPAVLLMHGTADTTISNSQSVLFGQAVAGKGSFAKVCLYKGAEHAFFNNSPWDLITLSEVKAHIAGTLLSDIRMPDGWSGPHFGGTDSEPAIQLATNSVSLRLGNLMPLATNCLRWRTNFGSGGWATITNFWPASTHETVEVPRSSADSQRFYQLMRWKR